MILLACTRLGATTPYPGTAALLPVLGAALVIGAGCAAPSQGCGRVLALPPMRAIGRVSYSWYLWHWPVLVLAPALLGHPLGLAGRSGSGRWSPAGWPCSPCVSSRTRCDSPLPCAGRPGRSLALGGAATAVAVCVGVALLVVVPDPVGRGPAAAALTVTAAPPPTGHNIDAYDAAVQHAFAQVQAAVAASADLKAVPSNLDPPLADAAAERRPCSSTAACAILSKSDSLSARRATPPRRRRWPWSATRMPRCGARRSSRSPRSGTGGWRPWPRRPAH